MTIRVTRRRQPPPTPSARWAPEQRAAAQRALRAKVAACPAATAPPSLPGSSARSRRSPATHQIPLIKEMSLLIPSARRAAADPGAIRQEARARSTRSPAARFGAPNTLGTRFQSYNCYKCPQCKEGVRTPAATAPPSQLAARAALLHAKAFRTADGIANISLYIT